MGNTVYILQGIRNQTKRQPESAYYGHQQLKNLAEVLALFHSIQKKRGSDLRYSLTHFTKFNMELPVKQHNKVTGLSFKAEL